VAIGVPDPARPAVQRAPATTSHAIRPYLQIARVDHWFKVVFMLFGVLLASFYRPELLGEANIGTLILALYATCIIASSNYVLNEWLDAPLDRLHPSKKYRPAALGLVRSRLVVLEWLVLAGLGIGAAFLVNTPFGLAGLAFWLLGCSYNIPPVRTKDIPYVDVLTESLNNPVRLLLGWLVFIPDLIPPLSLIIAYWMLGAFFMATKRFAELRHIANPARAAGYRRSFAHYDENRLLASMVFYVAACAFFSGIFIVRYKLELLLCAPAVAGLFSFYFLLGVRKNSPVQSPEKLYRVRGFVLYGLFTLVLFVALMFAKIEPMYDLFNCEPSHVEPLWSISR